MTSKALEIPFWLIQKNPHVNYDRVIITRGEILSNFENGAEKVRVIEDGDDDMFDAIIAYYPNGKRYIWKCEELTGKDAR